MLQWVWELRGGGRLTDPHGRLRRREEVHGGAVQRPEGLLLKVTNKTNRETNMEHLPAKLLLAMIYLLMGEDE